MKLTSKERLVLAHGQDTEFWRLFRKHFMEGRQMELVQKTVFHDEIKNVHIDRGAIIEIKHIDKEMRKIYTDQEKQEKTNG